MSKKDKTRPCKKFGPSHPKARPPTATGRRPLHRAIPTLAAWIARPSRNRSCSWRPICHQRACCTTCPQKLANSSSLSPSQLRKSLRRQSRQRRFSKIMWLSRACPPRRKTMKATLIARSIKRWLVTWQNCWKEGVFKVSRRMSWINCRPSWKHRNLMIIRRISGRLTTQRRTTSSERLNRWTSTIKRAGTLSPPHYSNRSKATTVRANSPIRIVWSGIEATCSLKNLTTCAAAWNAPAQS